MSCRLTPRISLLTFRCRWMKTSRALFREFPGLKKRLWKGELWEDGFFARTVGDKMTAEVIEKYIKNHRAEQQAPAQLDIDGTSNGS